MVAMENPFNYLQFATGDQFYDRREIRQNLLSRFLSGQTNVVLYGPRRYGKSSLVAELVVDLERAGIPCVTLDVVKVPSIDMFVSSYATKVYRRLAPVKFEFRKLGTFLGRLRPKLLTTLAASRSRRWMLTAHTQIFQDSTATSTNS